MAEQPEHKAGATVKLVLRGDEAHPHEFTVSHAQALLKLQAQQNRDGWQLAKNSKYEFTDGKLNKRGNTSTVRKAKK